ncbi:MAG TPA: hypothetical protein VGN63_11350 [Flavisolibacter sp.]|jgi:hypothetical protein|nr:hypothetical protein [Flavisolibacter sp.]
MAEDKKQQTNHENQAPENEAIRGRIHNSQNPEFEKQDVGRDISEVDQQEGNMNNGESGDKLTGVKDNTD